MMTKWEVAITVVASALAVFLPVAVLLLRGLIKWTRVEDKLDHVANNLTELIAAKDKTHAAMLEQMRSDREATDKRLRFVEETFMEMGKHALRNP